MKTLCSSCSIRTLPVNLVDGCTIVREECRIAPTSAHLFVSASISARGLRWCRSAFAAVVLSPSAQSVATYNEVRVIRSWKGRHYPGDILIFGVPAGSLPCEPSSPGIFTRRFDVSGPYFAKPNVYVLFLRQSKGNETKMVQGLFPAAGQGVQGIFQIAVLVPPRFDSEDYCAGVGDVNGPHCDAIMQTSQSPVVVPYAHDPLAKKYGGMPAADFLRELQSVTGAQGVAEKASSK